MSRPNSSVLLDVLPEVHEEASPAHLLNQRVQQGLLARTLRPDLPLQHHQQRPHGQGSEGLLQGPQVPGLDLAPGVSGGPARPGARLLRQQPERVGGQAQREHLPLEDGQQDAEALRRGRRLQSLPVRPPEVHGPRRVRAVAKSARVAARALAPREVEARPDAHLGVAQAPGIGRAGARGAAGEAGLPLAAVVRQKAVAPGVVHAVQQASRAVARLVQGRAVRVRQGAHLRPQKHVCD
mmetsp:Transcript_47584/g.128379  ORF Transcript_47584/g.128379 Transcript_47584/m.128379 type:complete len:238 (+) Transcript_47584:393-1106(+)